MPIYGKRRSRVGEIKQGFTCCCNRVGAMCFRPFFNRYRGGGGGGTTGALASPHRPQKSTLSVLINDLKQSELIIFFSSYDCVVNLKNRERVKKPHAFYKTCFSLLAKF